MDFYLYVIFGMGIILVMMGFLMFIMYFKYVMSKRFDSRASCIEMATDTINDSIKQELSDMTAHSIGEDLEELKQATPDKDKTLVQMIHQQPKEHPITQQPLPDDIHDLFNPKLQPKKGVLVQFSEMDLLSFPKTALSGNEMIKEIKLQSELKERDEDDVPLELIRTNSSKRVGRSVVKYPKSQQSRESSMERGATSRYGGGSRYAARNNNASRHRATSRARSDYDDRHAKFEHPKYRNKDFDAYYLKFLVPTISAVVQQTLAQTNMELMHPKNNYVDQWVTHNQDVGSVDGLQTPSLKSF